MQLAGRTILWQDIVIILAFVMYFGAGICTNFALAEISKYTEYAEQLEANPTMRLALDLDYTILMVQIVTVSFLAVLYFMNRRNFMRRRTEPMYIMFTTYTIFVFMTLFQNFINDLPIAVRLLTGA